MGLVSNNRVAGRSMKQFREELRSAFCHILPDPEPEKKEEEKPEGEEGEEGEEPPEEPPAEDEEGEGEPKPPPKKREDELVSMEEAARAMINLTDFWGMLVRPEDCLRVFNDMAFSFKPKEKVEGEEEEPEEEGAPAGEQEKLVSIFNFETVALRFLRQQQVVSYYKEFQHTLCIIKPDAVSAGYVPHILMQLEENGFSIARKIKHQLTTFEAEKLYEEHEHEKYFPDMVKYMTEGPIVVLVLEKFKCVDSLRSLMGPTDPVEAAAVRPESLRALYGAGKGIVGRIDASQDIIPVYEAIDDFVGFATRVIINGPPGVGKGTQSKLLEATRGLKRVVAGELLRKEIESSSELGRKARDCIEQGSLVPDTLMAQIVAAELNKCQHGWVLDGFPKTQAQAVALKECGVDAEKFVLLQIDDQLLIDRIARRRLDPATGIVYNMVEGDMPADGVDESSLVFRADDYPQKTQERIEVYREKLEELLTAYESGVIRNAVHGSKRPNQVDREIEIFFPRLPMELDQTLAIIKPDTVAAGALPAVINVIRKVGFKILVQEKCNLTVAQTEEFYKDHKAKSFFNDLVQFMTSGPVVILVLERVNAVSVWRQLVGPTDPANALVTAPFSLRGLYGVSILRNAFHGSNTDAEARREVDFFFPDLKNTQRTLAMIKPDAVKSKKEDEIRKVIETAGFRIVDTKTQTLTEDQVKQFYAEHASKPFFPNLAKLMTSGDSMQLVLERKGAIRAWRALMGPTNSTVAKETDPDSLRAKYGYDGTMNAVHGSDAVESANRELRFFFPHLFQKQKTFAIIKPDAVRAGYTDAILSEITKNGFVVVDKEQRKMTLETVREFYAEHEGKTFFSNLCTFMTSGPVVVLVLERAGAVKEWRALMGPTNTFNARILDPSCLRARFGTDGTMNAVHGSASVEEAHREIHFFFPDLTIDKLPDPEFVKDFMNEKLSKTLKVALTELCRKKPANPIKWLGEFLIQNNPNKPRVIQPPSEDAAIKNIDEARYNTIKTGSRIVFVLGGPGSGKGTQCANIVKEFKYTHLSAGDLLRDEVKSKSELGEMINEMMRNGAIVPAEVTIQLLKKAMAKSGSDRFLIDGFPRKLDQAVIFEKEIGKCDFVLFYDCPPAVMEQRLLGRGKTSGRVDDNPETIKKRFDTFIKTSMPVVDYFERVGKVRRISAIPTPDEVYVETRRCFQPDCVFVMGGPGSGKRTQCQLIARDYGYYAISTGDVLRAEVERGTAYGERIRNIWNDNETVPDDLCLKLLRAEIMRSNKRKFLIEGFPRTVEQLELFEKHVATPKLVLSFDCSDKVMVKRIEERGKMTGSASDNSKIAKKRIESFKSKTSAVVTHYVKTKKEIVKQIAAGGSVEEVYALVQNVMNPKVVFVVGPPGSGKTSVCALLAERSGYTHLSMGDLLYNEVESNSELGYKIQQHMNNGTLVETSVVLDMLRNCMADIHNNRFLIDGFPRTVEQGIAFEETFIQSRGIIHLDVERDVCISRLLARGKQTGRHDDNEESILKQLRTYENETVHVIDYYSSSNRIKEQQAEAVAVAKEEGLDADAQAAASEAIEADYPAPLLDKVKTVDATSDFETLTGELGVYLRSFE